MFCLARRLCLNISVQTDMKFHQLGSLMNLMVHLLGSDMTFNAGQRDILLDIICNNIIIMLNLLPTKGEDQ